MSVRIVSPTPPFRPASRHGYADAFTVDRPPGAGPLPARTVAQQALGGAEAAHGLFATVVWRAALGLDVHLGAPATIAGWTVEDETDERLLLSCGGRRTRGRMEFRSRADAVTWTTALDHLRPSSRLVWAGAAPVHRAAVRRILGRLA